MVSGRALAIGPIQMPLIGNKLSVQSIATATTDQRLAMMTYTYLGDPGDAT